MRPIALFLLSVLFLPACGVDPSDRAEIEGATVAFVRDTGVRDVRVEVAEVVGDHARARVLPADGSTEPAWVFLRREDAGWTGVALGTAFAPEDYRELGIPASLRVR